jgi:hypothetical protein
MKSKEILKLATDYQNQNSNWRWGQCVFNAAYELYPNAADSLRGTIVDCFHKDKVVEEFLQIIDNNY